jgi:hypothetical protein
MSDEKKSRIKVDDLEQEEKELTSEESKDVKGGAFADGSVRLADMGDGSVRGVTSSNTKITDGTSNTLTLNGK